MSHCNANWISRDLYDSEEMCELWIEKPVAATEEYREGEFLSHPKDDMQAYLCRMPAYYVDEMFGITPPERGQCKRLKPDVQRRKHHAPHP